VHYVGGATQLTAMMDFAAGYRGAFKMQRQGEDDGSEVYIEFHAAGSCAHRYRPGPKTFVRDLVEKYPGEERAIRRFFWEVNIAAAGMGLVVGKQFMPAWLWKALLRFPGPVKLIASRYMRRSLAQAMTDCGLMDSMLRATVAAEFGDYGMTPDKAPFFLHAGILTHYMPEGGFSPVGGSEMFAKVLVDAIHAAGGAVLVRAPVAKILVENGRATGVEMAGGKGVVKARHSVISAAGVEVTYRKLLNEVTVQKLGRPPQSLLESERNTSAGSSHHVYGFFGIEGDTEELKLPTYNVWSLPPVPGVKDSTDVTAIWNRLFAASPGQLPEFLTSDEAAKDWQVPAFISFPSAKDKTYKERCPGKSVAVIITESRAEYFGKNLGPPNKRGEEYTQIKKRYEQLLKNALFRHFPQLQGKISYIDVGTPQSNEHYLGRTSSYGLDQSVDRFLDPTLRIAVPGLSGLYLTGQDLICDGVFPQPIVAWITLSKVLGVTSPDFWLLFCDFALSVGRRVLFDRTYAPKNP